MRRTIAVFALALGLSQTSCIKKAFIASQASGTREASSALDEIGDQNVARTAAMNGLAQFEGMHKLSPNNEDVLFMLTKGWVSYGFAFAQDDMEQTEEGSDAYEEHKRLATFAFERAIKYGLELMSHEDEGFEAARKNDATLKTWLKENFDDKDQAQGLFWAGYAWLARVNLLRDQPAVVGELWVGVAMIERSYELDPDYNNYVALTALAAYHARASMAELDEAKRMFELALQKSQRKNLLVHVNYATRYACLKGDRNLYESLLQEALKFDETSAPKLRLGNTISKKKAKRALDKKFMASTCGFDMSKPSTVIPDRASGVDNGDVSPEDFLKPGPTAPPAPTTAPTPPPAPAPSATTPPAPAPSGTAPKKPADPKKPEKPAAPDPLKPRN